jgi:PAS domain S-box-containing protein
MSPDGVGRFSRLQLLPLWIRASLFAAAYYISAAVGSYFSAQGGTFVGFWLPAGLYVAALLLVERREWPWFILGALIANSLFDFFHGTRPVLILLFAFNNTLQALLGAWLYQRFLGKKPDLTTLKEFTGLLGFAAVLSTLPSALIGAWALTHFSQGGSFLESYKVWWGSCGMAVLVLTPFLLTWLTQQPRQRLRPASRFEAAILFLTLIVSTWYILGITGGILSPYKAWLVPLLLWAGLRFGVRGATAATLLLSLLSVFLTTRFLKGMVPGQIASGDYAFALQSALVAASLVGLIPAIVLAERDRTLAKLQDNEEHLHNLTQAAFEGIGISENARIVDVNDQMLTMFGYDRHEMIGRNIVDLVAPESRETVSEAIRTGRESIYEHRLLRKDGSIFIAEARAKTVRIGNRKVRMTALRDITDRKLSEELNKTQTHVLEMLTRGEPLKKILDALIQMIEAQSPEMLSSILLLDPDGKHMRAGAAPSLPADFVKTSDGLPIGPCAGSCGTAAYRHAPVFVSDIATDPLWADGKQFALPHGLRACWSTPIFDAQRRVLGTFAIYYRSPGLPNERHLRLIATATYTAAVCITKHRADEALHESEDRFRTLVESSPDCIAVAVDERLAYLNPAGLKLIKVKNFDEVAGRSVYDFAPPELRDQMHVRRQIVLERGIPSPLIEFPLQLPDGTAVLVESQAVPFVYLGQPAILNLMREITQRKRAETERAETTKREQKAREEFTHLLISSQEAERKRIAGELHDSLGQNLSVIKNRARLAAQQSIQPAAAAHLQAIERIVSAAIDETRNLAHNLRPAHIEHVGLTASLREMIREVSQSSQVRFERRVEDVDGIFKGEAATNVYRILQEALNNLIRHSHAREAVITIERDVHSVRLLIADDGVGFDTRRAAKRRGLGLTSMGERVRMLGGKLSIQSNPGQGTQLSVELPIATEPDNETAAVEI